ncbi:MAG: hypothetical protein ACI4KF_05885 [Huintestinicola sp.]
MKFGRSMTAGGIILSVLPYWLTIIGICVYNSVQYNNPFIALTGSAVCLLMTAAFIFYNKRTFFAVEDGMLAEYSGGFNRREYFPLTLISEAVIVTCSSGLNKGGKDIAFTDRISGSKVTLPIKNAESFLHEYGFGEVG